MTSSSNVIMNVHGKVEPFCCWLRPAPPNLDLNLYCTYNQILEAVNLQEWYPPNCHYCVYGPKNQDDFERHIVNRHPGKLCYPGPTPEKTARALYIVESIERELNDRRAKRNAVAKAKRKEKAGATKQ